MSHELRTPLNSIIGFSKLLIDYSQINEYEKQKLNLIYKGGEHLLTLINDILDISKIEIGKIDILPVQFNFASFIRTIESIINEQAKTKSLIFSCKIPPDVPDIVEADATRLRQVLLNLLSNAVKYTRTGEIILDVSVIEIVDAKTDTIRFEVIDTGIGIENNKIGRIFKPFDQVLELGKTSEGTGLGLSISQNLVRLMGGELKVKSEFGKGSRFWFDLVLPVFKDMRSKNEVKAKVVGYKGRRLKSLVADDNPHNLILMADMLNGIGFDVITAIDGEQEVDRAGKYLPDVILTDLRMPVMDGNSAVMKIRDIPDLKNRSMN